MKYCIHCGKEISDTAGFCPHCGKKQAKTGENKERGASERISAEKAAWKETVKEKVSQAKEKSAEFGKAGVNTIQDNMKVAKEKGISAGKLGLQMLNEERNSNDIREFRIVDDKGYFAGIIIFAILAVIQSFVIIVDRSSISAETGKIQGVITALIAFYLLGSILNVRKTYLSDYFTIPILTSIMFFANAVLGLGEVWRYVVIFSFILSVVSVILFKQILKGKSRKTWLLLVLFLNLVMQILLIHQVNLIQMSLILLVLSISNDPGKAYASKPEPSGKHIRTRSIGFSVAMSIMTFGLYFYIIWTYCIISDIRKLEGKRGIALGEWLLYGIIPIYDLVWLYTRANKLSVIGINNKIKSNGSGGFFVFMHIIFLDIVNMALIQSTLNDLAQVMDGDFVYGTVLRQNRSEMSQTAVTDVDYMEKLTKLNELKNAGIISEEEFEQKKKQFLAKI